MESKMLKFRKLIIFVVLLFIITVFIKIFITPKKDLFKVLSYNSLQVIDESDLNVPDKNIIVNNLNNIYSVEPKFQEQLNLVPFYTKIPIENDIKKILDNKINLNLQLLNKDTNYSVELTNNELYNIRWIDKDSTRHFIVNYDIGFLKNGEKIFIDTFTIYFTISNITNYLINSTEYNPFNKINSNDVNILSISLTNNENFKFTPNSQSINNEDDFYNYYYIKNKLFLLDPFLTSGKEMQLVNSMSSGQK